MHRRSRAVAVFATLGGFACAPELRPPDRLACVVEEGEAAIATANDQREPAGVLIGDTLHVLLDMRPAVLVPEGDDGPRLPGAAFAVAGGAPVVPGPLLRAPAGTMVRADVCNALSDTAWLVVPGRPDTVAVPPGTSRVITMPSRGPGFGVYRAITRADSVFRFAGPNGQLAGGLVFDGGVRWGERVLVITDWAPGPREDVGEELFMLLVNGKSWPHTERLRYGVGDTARWAVINASPVEHPMHLHGFHFTVRARSNAMSDSVYAADHAREAVTETLLPGESMALDWIPERGGFWLFHCHIASHMDDAQRYAALGVEPPEGHTHADGESHAETGMAGLVVGIEVEGDPAAGLASGAAVGRERLLMQRRPGVYGNDPGYGFVRVRGAPPAPDSIVVPGEPLVLNRDEPVEIVVVNRLDVATSVHWHGLEIESYFDGMPGWTGDRSRRSPLLAPGDSLVVRLAPPRTGTYIYHAHADELRQLGSGLFGPIIVIEPDASFDTAVDHVLLLSMAGPDIDIAPVVVNNGAEPALTLAADRENRVRLINITADDLVSIETFAGDTLIHWRVVANDGAALPDALTQPVPARLRLGPGETADVVFTPARGDLRVAVSSFNDFEVILRAR